jgi:polyisoprenyl-phosphate glycosyltransferase
MPTDKRLVSIVVPAMNEADCLPTLSAELQTVAAALAAEFDFEFLFVDDGSGDATAQVLAGLRRKDGRVRYLVLSRNFGHQAAISAGLAHARGDAVIMMDADLQHPPALIPELLQHWQAGYDVVNTVRMATRDASRAKQALSRAFYCVFNWVANIHIQPDAADFRLLSRPVVEIVKCLPERHRFWRGLIPWLGFRQTNVRFVAPARYAGRPKYNFVRNLQFALDGISSFSFYPLRRLMMLGWLVTLLSGLYGLWALGSHLWGSYTVPGWTSLLLCVLFLGGVQLTAIGAVAEYVGRILEQVKGRPLYIVREDQTEPLHSPAVQRNGAP